MHCKFSQLLRKTIQNDKQDKLDDTTMMLVNNCCALPLMLIRSVLMRKIEA
jgi:hypothetical protein